MATNTLQVTQSLDKARVKLSGDMSVAFDSAVTSTFSISFFTTTAETFTFTSTFTIIDYHGDSVQTLQFGGEPGKFIELMFDSIAQKWFIVATNAGAYSIGTTRKLITRYSWETDVSTPGPTVKLKPESTTVIKRGNFSLTANVTSTASISKVEFYRNGILFFTDTTAPFVAVDVLNSNNNGTIQYYATAYDIQANVVSSSTIDIEVNIPVVHEMPTARFDSVTQSEYDSAIESVPVGSKRMAAANALATAFEPDHRLYIYKDGELIIPIEYSGSMSIVQADNEIYVQPSTTIDSSDPLKVADLTTGTWWFELQGGSDYSRVITGTVGNINSNAELQLQENPAPNLGFSSVVKFVIPNALDGLN